VCEVHGSLLHLQCSGPCGSAIWPANFAVEVDAARCLLTSPLPRCPACGSVARPNVLMFGDAHWLAWRTEIQWARLQEWLAGVRRPVAVEIGAGTAIPTVRHFCESHAAALIRINPRDARVRGPHALGLAATGLQALTALERCGTAGFFSAGDARYQ